MKRIEEHMPLVKVCGLTRAEDVQLCLELGVDMTGFIFASGSPRRITPARAAGLPRGRALRVGVFAGQSPFEVVRIMKESGMDYAQLHGGEDAAFCRAVGPERVIKVLWPQRLGREKAAPTAKDMGALLRRACEPFAGACSFFLLDAGAGGGGSGKALPWNELAASGLPRPWLLAGGIGPENAVEAYTACLPHGLDCNSGLESAPGVKNARALRELMVNVTALRAARA